MIDDGKEFFAIWRARSHPQIRDYEELIGVIYDDHEAADNILYLLNLEEEKATGRREVFRRSFAVDQITLKNWKEWVTQ